MLMRIASLSVTDTKFTKYPRFSKKRRLRPLPRGTRVGPWGRVRT